MDPTVTTLVFYGVIWIGIYLVGRALKIERLGFVLSPLYFMYKTTALNNWIGSLAERNPRLWRALGNAGIAVGVGLMAFALYTLALNLYHLIFRVEAATSIQPVIPLPGLTISWESFPYLVLAISLVLATHELAHGVATRVDKVPLKSAGLFVAVILFGGFVEPDEEQLEKAPSETRLTSLCVEERPSASTLFTQPWSSTSTQSTGTRAGASRRTRAVKVCPGRRVRGRRTSIFGRRFKRPML